MWTTSSAAYLAPPAPGQPDAWTTETRGHGSQRIAAAGRTDAAPEVAGALGVTEGAPVIHRSRVILMDNEPVEVVTSYYRGDLPGGDPLADPRPIKGGAVRLLADLGYCATSVIEDVSAERADAETMPLVPEGLPLLVIRRTSYAADGAAYEYTVMASWDGRRQRYAMELV